MKVEFLTLYAGENGIYHPGMKVILDDKLAASLIKIRAVRELEPVSKKPEDKTGPDNA